VLACELAKSTVSGTECALPARLQTLTREGTTIGVADNFDGSVTLTRDITQIPQIKTGIWLIDSWVSSALLPKFSAGVMSPDYRRGR
jgi:hypothetical protein